MTSPTDPQALLRHAVRDEFVAFVIRCYQFLNPGQRLEAEWYILAICHRLLCCERGETRRVIINVPPRHLKSMITSIAFPAWLLGHDPGKRVAVVTYGQELCSDLAREFRRVSESDWYRSYFPGTVFTKMTETEMVTPQGGYRLTTSVGGALTGRGADLIILDDPMKAQDAYSQAARNQLDEWVRSALISRLNNPSTGVIILVQQRLHEDDLTGRLLKRNRAWRLLSLPAIAEQAETIPIGDNGAVHHRAVGELLRPRDLGQQVLDDIKAGMASMNFAAQYQQNPLPEQGNILKRHWFRYYDEPLEPQPSDTIIMALDTAIKDGANNDYSAAIIAVLRGKDIYVQYIWRDRMIYPDLKRQVERLCTEYQVKTLLIEDSASGTNLAQEFNRISVATILIRPQESKAQRVNTQSDVIEEGRVRLPHDAPWNDDFLAEISGFPAAAHDDQIDALVMLVGWARQHTPPLFDADFGKDEHGQIPDPYDLLYRRLYRG
jgi:predicted phage terminase large subunit-like protein